MKYIFVILLLFSMVCARAQTYSLTFEELELLRNKEARPIAVFIYTDWCKYCAHMKATTFRDEEVINLLNNKFYFTKLNAEQQSPITFNGFYFGYIPTGNEVGVHQLAKELGTIRDQLSYPTFVVLNPNLEIIFQYDGFMDKETMRFALEKLINYK